MVATSGDAVRPQAGVSALGNPWVQLIIGIICMACVANLQYGWTLFVNPIDAKYHWGREAIQVAFTIFVVIETWLVPVEGYLVDRFGPKWVVIGGGILVGLAWVINSAAGSLPVLYFAAVIGGIGTGCVYGTCVGNALKWFPGRRGIAAGRTAAGFGAGAAATIIPISHMIGSAGYEQAFLVFGLIQGGIVFVVGGLLPPPPRAIAGYGGQAEPDRSRLFARRGAAQPVLLRAVHHVRVDRGRWIDDGGESGTHCEGLQDREGAGRSVRNRVAGSGVRAVAQPNIGWFRPAVLRLALGSDRARIHHGARILHRCRSVVHPSAGRVEPRGIRTSHCALFRRLRRDFQLVPRDPGRHLRIEVRSRECGHAVHGEGCGCAAGVRCGGH